MAPDPTQPKSAPNSAGTPFEGQQPRLASDAWVAPGADVIGDVEIGAESSVWYGCVLRGDLCAIRIGARSNVQDGSIIHVTHTGLMTQIGDEVMVGHGCVLHACSVETRAFVGIRSVLLDDSVVESGGMLAAGALLAPGKRVRSGELWAGVPARYVRPIMESEKDEWAKQVNLYVDLARRHRQSENSETQSQNA